MTSKLELEGTAVTLEYFLTHLFSNARGRKKKVFYPAKTSEILKVFCFHRVETGFIGNK